VTIQPATHCSRDLLACDVQLSLFVGAARSYRHDSSLSPFPPCFMTASGTKDIQGVQEAVMSVPPLSCLKRQLEQRSCKLTAKQLQLILWIFNGGPSQLTLSSLPRKEHREVLGRVGASAKSALPLPTYVFEVKNNNSNRWQERCEGEETFYAFHGSRLDNWFSILHNGLQQHRGKTSLFGEGIYLSSELGVSLNYSSRGSGWDSSHLGSSVSCLAISHIINHPSVKIHSECQTRGRVEGSEGGSIPENYILVRNNQLVNIRYIMVYCSEGRPREVSRNRLTAWMRSHSMVLVLVAYGFLLLLVGLSNSSWMKRVMRRNGLIN